MAFTATLGSLQPEIAGTTRGAVTTTLTAGDRGGVAIVIGTAGPITDSLSLAVGQAGRPFRVSLTATPSQVQVGSAQPVLIQAQVADWQGDAVADGAAVRFSVSRGQPDPEMAQTVSGMATA